MKKGKRASTAELRRRAEERLNPCDGGVGVSSPGEAERLIHELQVHQIELELQNEELERTRGELEAGQQRYAELYDFAPIGYLTLDRDGTIQRANLAGARLLGLERSRLVGGRFGLFVTDASRAVFNAFLTKVFDSKTGEVCEIALQTGGSGVLSVHIAADAAKDGQECRAVLLDITERKRAEEALQAADERRNHFLAVLSHELRNPLAPIMNSLFVLERAAPGEDQARRAIAVIERQARQLTRLVDDLLDVTRITRNRIQLQQQRLDLNELVRATIDDYRSQFETGGISLQVISAPGPVHVHADANRLAQVIGNLLQNALKFTDRNGEVRVTVSVEVDAGEPRAVVRVADTGVGMAPWMLFRIFDPFSQADRTLDRSKGGLGLGLALAKGLVELHGGDVSARSEGLGKGAEFTVRLPLVEVADLVETPTARPAEKCRPRRIRSETASRQSARAGAGNSAGPGKRVPNS